MKDLRPWRLDIKQKIRTEAVIKRDGLFAVQRWGFRIENLATGELYLYSLYCILPKLRLVMMPRFAGEET